MALLNKLEQVRTVKQSLFVLQHRFFAELVKRYPHIMKSDMADVTNRLEEELHLMLCCALRHRSVKIPLKAKGRYSSADNTIVNVQRGEVGFYYPHSERGHSDIYYMKLAQYINDKDDMWIKYTETEYGKNDKRTEKTKDSMLVQLSDLKKIGKRAIPDKMDFYFKILKEVMAYRPKFLCYTSEGYSANIGKQFNLGGMRFALLPRSMDIQVLNAPKKAVDDDDDDDVGGEDASMSDYEPGSGDYDLDPVYRYSSGDKHKYDVTSNDMFHMLDYNGTKDNHFDPVVHERLKLFIKNYDAIRQRLEVEEAEKKKAYQTCMAFLEQLRTHTVPFKVLGEITGK